MGFSMQGWEHDLDRYLTTDPRDDKQPVYECGCGRGIYDGDDYYEIGGKRYCAECIDSFKKTAEYPDEWFGEE